MRVALLVVFCFWLPMRAQQKPESLPPSEALKAAVNPFDQARAQPNDLTDADQLALGVGMQRASAACQSQQTTAESLKSQPKELLALTRLCLFGQQFESARQQAVRYLELPSPPEREMGLLLLSQAFLGLKDTANAAQQVFSLIKDYPYDAQIHFAADQVILAGALLNDFLNRVTLQLCSDQLKVTLPLLESGKALPGKQSSASAATLFTDAVRCSDIARDLNDISGTIIRNRLGKILQVPAWQGTAEFAGMESALRRTEMISHATPIKTLTGELVPAAGALLPHTVRLTQGTELLVPFTLWVPGTAEALRDFPATAPLQRIYLVTSWSANTGGADEQSPEMLQAMRALAAELPKQAHIMVVKDADIRKFDADTYPGAIVVRDGIVQTNIPLMGKAGQRMTVLALGPVQTSTVSRTKRPKDTSHP